jgi:hypothetical protein
MKGQFYSVMIALFVIPLLALIIFYSQTTTPQNIDTNIRADELQYFSESIGEDLIRFLQINGKRALIAAVNMTITNGKGLDDAPGRLVEMIKNGTLNGTQPFADQKNLTTWEKNITDIALNSGFLIEFKNETINVTQNDSFSILFSATVYVNISDATAGMGIFKNMSVASAISIDRMIDPLYSIKTNGTVFKTIKISPLNKIANPSTDLSNLTSNIKNGYYYNSINGASLLDRLEGKVVLSEKHQPYGLESFVYLPDFVSAGLYVNSQSSDLDYQYWTNTEGYLLNYSKSYDPPLDSVYQWFRINCFAAADYNINNLLNSTC